MQTAELISRKSKPISCIPLASASSLQGESSHSKSIQELKEVADTGSCYLRLEKGESNERLPMDAFSWNR